MAFWTFRRSKRIVPGLRLNIGKGGPSFSLRRRAKKKFPGVSLSVGKRGGRGGFSLFGFHLGQKLW